jgi:type IV secretion system protein VirB6
MGIGQAVEAAVDGMLQTFVASKSEALCVAIVPIALTGATIHLLIMGLAIIRGEANDPLHTFVWKCFRTALIASIALSVGTYQSTIIVGANGIEGALIEAMSGAASVGQLVDDMAQPFADLGQQLWSKAVVGFWPNLGLVAAAGSVSIAEFFIIAIGLGFYLLAKVALSLVFAVGPAFVLCAMWPGTEKYTESWIGQVLNFVILKVLVAASMAMLMTFASQFAGHINVNQDAVNVIKATSALVICSGALGVVMLNLPQLASALAGGASISGIGRTIGRALIDTLNRSEKSGSKSPPSGGRITQGGGRGGQTSTGPAPPPRQPLYQRNTIERIRKAT